MVVTIIIIIKINQKLYFYLLYFISSPFQTRVRIIYADQIIIFYNLEIKLVYCLKFQYLMFFIQFELVIIIVFQV